MQLAGASKNRDESDILSLRENTTVSFSLLVVRLDSHCQVRQQWSRESTPKAAGSQPRQGRHLCRMPFQNKSSSVRSGIFRTATRCRSYGACGFNDLLFYNWFAPTALHGAFSHCVSIGLAGIQRAQIRFALRAVPIAQDVHGIFRLPKAVENDVGPRNQLAHAGTGKASSKQHRTRAAGTPDGIIYS